MGSCGSLSRLRLNLCAEIGAKKTGGQCKRRTAASQCQWHSCVAAAHSTQHPGAWGSSTNGTGSRVETAVRQATNASPREGRLRPQHYQPAKQSAHPQAEAASGARNPGARPPSGSKPNPRGGNPPLPLPSPSAEIGDAFFLELTEYDGSARRDTSGWIL
jgi:hypothetical protein